MPDAPAPMLCADAAPSLTRPPPATAASAASAASALALTLASASVSPPTISAPPATAAWSLRAWFSSPLPPPPSEHLSPPSSPVLEPESVHAPESDSSRQMRSKDLAVPSSASERRASSPSRLALASLMKGLFMSSSNSHVPVPSPLQVEPRSASDIADRAAATALDAGADADVVHETDTAAHPHSAVRVAPSASPPSLAGIGKSGSSTPVLSKVSAVASTTSSPSSLLGEKPGHPQQQQADQYAQSNSRVLSPTTVFRSSPPPPTAESGPSLTLATRFSFSKILNIIGSSTSSSNHSSSTHSSSSHASSNHSPRNTPTPPMPSPTSTNFAPQPLPLSSSSVSAPEAITTEDPAFSTGDSSTASPLRKSIIHVAEEDDAKVTSVETTDSGSFDGQFEENEKAALLPTLLIESELPSPASVQPSSAIDEEKEFKQSAEEVIDDHQLKSEDGTAFVPITEEVTETVLQHPENAHIDREEEFSEGDRHDSVILVVSDDNTVESVVVDGSPLISAAESLEPEQNEMAIEIPKQDEKIVGESLQEAMSSSMQLSSTADIGTAAEVTLASDQTVIPEGVASAAEAKDIDENALTGLGVSQLQSGDLPQQQQRELGTGISKIEPLNFRPRPSLEERKKTTRIVLDQCRPLFFPEDLQLHNANAELEQSVLSSTTSFASTSQSFPTNIGSPGVVVIAPNGETAATSAVATGKSRGLSKDEFQDVMSACGLPRHLGFAVHARIVERGWVYNSATTVDSFHPNEAIEADAGVLVDWDGFERFIKQFWELDRDRDMLLTIYDLEAYGRRALSHAALARIIECYGITAGPPSSLLSASEGEAPQVGAVDASATRYLGYKEFIAFILSVEEKTSDSALEYWFRVLDLDGDGVLSLLEIETFWEHQHMRLPEQYTVLDLIRPQATTLTLMDLKRNRTAAGLFLDFLLDSRKHMENMRRGTDVGFRLRDEVWGEEDAPVVTEEQQQRDDGDSVVVEVGSTSSEVRRYKLEGWAKFSERAYRELSAPVETDEEEEVAPGNGGDLDDGIEVVGDNSPSLANANMR
ncbi:Serine/threonine-protein phosphatase 2A regulatory subunit B'' subunit beta [Entophlyctis luteolus]|nr:Serine/threonine-protein phosphatase 2A regulatory subunit B'' subunit beta [Entophlyctis luteolus]